MKQRTCSDHPRSRGEYFPCFRLCLKRSGSSPLSRGIPLSVSAQLKSTGIIPALAGNTADREWCKRGRGDHPRSRGEYWITAEFLKSPLGSSPLSRGIPAVRGRRRFAGGIIPALAGNTSQRFAPKSFCTDHPRSRGEYLGRLIAVAGQVGSSPLSRGIHLLTRDFISRICQILGTPSSHVSASRSHSPRVCDGHPPGGASRLARHLKDLDGPSGSAPRSRLVPMDHPMSGRTYPARSWHGTP